MGITHLSGLEVAGVPTMGMGGLPTVIDANYWFVNNASGGGGSDGNTGAADSPFATIGRALQSAKAGDVIGIAPGTYAEALTISQNNLQLVGLGPYTRSQISPAAGLVALTISGKGVTLINLDVVGGNGVNGADVTGDLFFAYGCKFECNNNIGWALHLHSTGVQDLTASMARIIDCEFAWATIGIMFTNSGSACTEVLISGCLFANCSDVAINESTATGAQVLTVQDCTFNTTEAGLPSGFIVLNVGGNTDTGIVTRCSFPTLINSGLNLVSTGIIWAGNYMAGGISAAQPS